MSLLDDEARRSIEANARTIRLRAGSCAFAAGSECHAFLIVLEGSVRVSVNTEGGREIMLYRVGPGETCVLTTACLLGNCAYDADAVAETPVEALGLPRRAFEQLLSASPAFRTFVFSSFGARLRDLIVLVQEIAVRQVDRRLARFLAERGRDGTIDMTHQAIASELGTAREVVTRLLRDFAERGWIETERGHTHIRDAAALVSHSGQT
jgi:CRP/FNR family transcriptional regulator